MTARYRITLLEPPRVKSVWRRASSSEIMGTVRRNTPLHTQPIVAGKLLEVLDGECDVEVVDGRLTSPGGEVLYKVMPYGGGRLEHYRVGLKLDSDRFRDIAQRSDILGITVNFTQEAGVAADVGWHARKINPRLKLIYAGSDVRARVDHYLRRVGADAVIAGDGERCGPALVRALLRGESLEGLGSVAYLSNGRVRWGCEVPGEAVPIEEVALPAFHLVKDDLAQWVESHEGDLPEGVQTPLAYVETSRGCHERCSFCYSAGLKYRAMKPPQIERYARHLKEWGIRSLLMMADNELTPILMPRVRDAGMSGRDLIIERFRIFRDHGFCWEFSNGLQYSMFRRDGRLDGALIDEMFSGCYRLFTPIEDPLDLPYEKLHGTPAERRLARRANEDIFREYHLEVLARIAASGVKMMTFGLMIGWPGDTLERVGRVAERCRMLRAAIAQANPACQILFTPFVGIPIPGTQNWAEFQSRDLIKEDVVTHPEAWQFALTTYGNFELVEARLQMIGDLDGADALREWTSTGVYPHQRA